MAGLLKSKASKFPPDEIVRPVQPFTGGVNGEARSATAPVRTARKPMPTSMTRIAITRPISVSGLMSP